MFALLPLFILYVHVLPRNTRLLVQDPVDSALTLLSINQMLFKYFIKITVYNSVSCGGYLHWRQIKKCRYFTTLIRTRITLFAQLQQLLL
jgi:hypothetical protein